MEGSLKTAMKGESLDPPQLRFMDLPLHGDIQGELSHLLRDASCTLL